jgi:hypothetical protein
MKVCPQCTKVFVEEVKACSDCGFSYEIEKFMVTSIKGIIKSYEQIISAVDSAVDKTELIRQKLNAEQFLEGRASEKNGSVGSK